MRKLIWCLFENNSKTTRKSNRQKKTVSWGAVSKNRVFQDTQTHSMTHGGYNRLAGSKEKQLLMALLSAFSTSVVSSQHAGPLTAQKRGKIETEERGREPGGSKRASKTNKFPLLDPETELPKQKQLTIKHCDFLKGRTLRGGWGP